MRVEINASLVLSEINTVRDELLKGIDDYTVNMENYISDKIWNEGQKLRETDDFLEEEVLGVGNEVPGKINPS